MWGNEGVPSTSAGPRDGRLHWLRIAARVVVLATIGAAATILLSQIEVTADSGETRACGSAFDGLVNREGWQTWWAGDLDEPDDEVRAELVRTRLCPDATNARILTASLMGFGALLAAALAWRLRESELRPERPTGTRARLRRLGAAGTALGALLTTAGLIGVIVLVADRDSTLFLYTDRLVVAVVGLVVLIPPIALIVIGRGLSILGSHSEASESADDHDAAMTAAAPR